MQAAGIMIMTTPSAMILNVEPPELICASHLVGREDMNAWRKEWRELVRTGRDRDALI